MRNLDQRLAHLDTSYLIDIAHFYVLALQIDETNRLLLCNLEEPLVHFDILNPRCIVLRHFLVLLVVAVFQVPFYNIYFYTPLILVRKNDY